MWLLVFFCTLTAVGGLPISRPVETTAHTTVSATPLNDTVKVMTPAAVNTIVTSMLDSPKPDTAEVGVVPLNDSRNVATPAAVNATVPSMLDSPKPDTAAVTLVPLNDTRNMRTPAAVNATVTSMLDSPKPDTAAVTLVPLNDSRNVATPAAVNATVTSMLDSPKPDTVGDSPKPDTTGVTAAATHSVATPAAGSSMLQPQPAEAETLEELQDDVIVQEGDILMPEDRNAVETLWADAIVPYSIGYDMADQEFNILSAFRMISDYTCIRFVPHTTEMNYLQFMSGKGCASFVGCRGGAQKLYYARTCSVGNLCHELIHALGLHHEHTRPDRDQFITVQWQSIKPGREKNFKVKHGNTLNLPYDLESITHYGSFFFSADGSPTVLSKFSGAQIGQRTHLSQLDIQRLNRLYRCDARMRG